MNPTTSLATLLAATLTSTLVVCPATLAEPTPLEGAFAAQDAVTVRFGKSGRYSWNGNMGDTISVTWATRRGLETRTGTLKNVTRSNDRALALTIIDSDGEIRTIFTKEITKITSEGAGTGASTAPAANRSSRGVNEPEEPAAVINAPEPSTTHAWGFPTTPGPGLEDKWPKVFLLPFEGAVGSYARHNEIKQIGEIADQYGDGQIIVLLVDSPGGLVAEGDEIRATLLDLQKRHRLVAWIHKAISAGAFTSFHCPEIVFTNSGTLGSITMFAGQKAIEGAQLAAWVKEVGDAAEGAGHNRELAEAMVTNPEMCSYDPADGDNPPVIYGNMEGEIILSTDQENLTINAFDAEACGFSRGTADTEEELARILGLPRWYETTDEGRRIHKNWHRKLERAKSELNDLFQRALGARGNTGDPVKNLTRQLTALRKLMKWHKDLGWNTIITFSQDAGVQPVPMEALEVREKEMSEQLARLRAAQRN